MARTPQEGYARIAALRSRFDAWREPPWPLLPLSALGWTYRLWIFFACTASVVGVPALLLGFDVHVAALDPIYLLVTVLVSFYVSTHVFRSDDVRTIEGSTVLALALVFSGRVGEALACGVVAMVAAAIRKPLTAHLVVLNVLVTAMLITVSATVFQALAGGAGPVSTQWAVAGFVAFLIFYALEVPTFGVTALTGGYVPMAETLRGAIEKARDHLISVIPLGVMMGAMMSLGNPVYAAVLTLPYLLTYSIFHNTDRLVEAKTEAQKDPLTGLNNRRTLLDCLNSVISGDPRAHSPQRNWVLLCDLDNFKALNDTRGHDIGDQALVAAAEQLVNSVRRDDYTSRYGGEEFVAIVRRVDRRGIEAISERLRSNIEGHLQGYQTTVSIGVHCVTEDDDPVSALNAADQAMYHSKRTGKNRVTFWDDLQVGLPHDQAA